MSVSREQRALSHPTTNKPTHIYRCTCRTCGSTFYSYAGGSRYCLTPCVPPGGLKQQACAQRSGATMRQRTRELEDDAEQALAELQQWLTQERSTQSL